MNEVSAYITGVGCSLCYGLATIFELIAARRQDRIKSISPKHLIRLFKQGYYVAGIVLDFAGWLLFLHTSKELPLFLGLSFVSFSLVVSAVIASTKLSVKVSFKDKIAMLLVVLGLILLSLVSEVAHKHAVSNGFELTLKLFPLPLAALGFIALKLKNRSSVSYFLSLLSGLSFGATGLIARLIHVAGFSNLAQVFSVSLIAYGALGAIYLAAALQRESINKVNCILFSTELIVPSLLGILYLGDRAKTGLWPLVLVSLVLVIGGTIIVALDTKASSTNLA